MKCKKTNPFESYFYTTYLEFFEFSDGLALKLFELKVSKLNLPVQIRKLKTKAKRDARECLDRINELKKMYALTYTDGYEATSPLDRLIYYESLDLMRKETAISNTHLFDSADDHKTIVLERRNG